MARTVRDPAGREWRIRRRWLMRGLRRPAFRRRRRRGDSRGSGGWEWLDVGGGDDVLGAIVLAIVAVVLIVIFVLFVWPLLVALVDALFVIVVAVFGALGRVALGRPWTVEATSHGDLNERRAWRVVGWRRSGRAIDEIAAAIERGEAQPAPSDAVAA